MTKKQQIVALLKEGLKYTEIAERTGSSYKYVANIAMDLKHPGCLSAYSSKFHQKHPEVHREWRKNNPEKRSKSRKKNLDFHQQKTKTIAHNHRQCWTIKDMEYLEEHSKEQTIHELALKLGRSYSAVQMFAFKMGIDLRGDKVGAGMIRFRGKYVDPKLSETKVVQV